MTQTKTFPLSTHNGPIRVLLVEDNENDYVYTHTLLASIPESQFELDWVSTYEAAIVAIASQQHDVYLLDYELGSHNGLEILRQSLWAIGDRPVIMLTGVGSRAVDLEAMQIGVISYLTKDEVSASSLERTIRYALKQKQAEAALERTNQAIFLNNLDLQESIDEYITKLKASEARLRRIIDSNMISILFIGLNGKIHDFNDAFLQIIGYTQAEFLKEPRNWQDMTPPEYHPTIEAAIAQVRQSGVTTPWEQEYVHRDNHRVAVIQGAALVDWAAKEMVCFILDISDRKQAEDQIKAALREKETLLAEIHHRVKNNLQVVSSLLRMQSRTIVEPEALAAFQESQERIQAMALIHERLYCSKNLSHIDFEQYIRDLAAELLQTYNVNSRSISLQVNANGISLNLKTAIPCGLIINELIANALKHAFPAGYQGQINITLDRSETDSDPHIDQYRLIVQDNGIGLPMEIDYQQPKTFGLNLVRILTQQLQGHVEVDRQDGTAFVVTFKELQ
jgi:PAS domain S-box-containing protein